ncbi:MAG: oligosaccharide flippase family protein [Geminicoccaceae bacterium]
MSARFGAAAAQTGAQVLVSLAGYATVVILGRELGPALFGAYSVVYSVLLAVETLGRLGIPQAINKLVAEEPDGSLRAGRAGITVGMLVFGTLFVAFFLLSPWLARWFNIDDGGHSFRVASLDIPFFGLFFIVNAILNGRQRFLAVAVVNGIYALIKALGIMALAAADRTSVDGALLINALGSAVALGIAAVMTGAGTWRPSFDGSRPLLRLAVPVTLRALGSQLLTSIGLWSLAFAGAAVAGDAKGLFAAALSLARLPNVVALGITGVVLSSMSRALAREGREAAVAGFRPMAKLMLAILVPSAAIMALEAGPLLELLLSPNYVGAAPELRVLAVGLGLGFTLAITLSAALVACSAADDAAVMSMAGGVLATAISLALAAPLGGQGAAWGTLAGCAVAAIGCGWRLWVRLGPWLTASDAVRIVVLTVGVSVLSVILPGQGLWLLGELAVIGLAYLALLPLTGLLRLSDLRRASGRGRGGPGGPGPAAAASGPDEP